MGVTRSREREICSWDVLYKKNIQKSVFFFLKLTFYTAEPSDSGLCLPIILIFTGSNHSIMGFYNNCLSMTMHSLMYEADTVYQMAY